MILEDDFPEHEKVISLSDKAFRFHVVALGYCNRNLTDGHVSTRAAKVVAAITNTRSDRWTKELVAARLWHRDKHGNGWWINDFLKHNWSAKDVKARRDQKRAAGKEGAKKRWETSSNLMADAIAPAMAPAMADAIWQNDGTTHIAISSVLKEPSPNGEVSLAPKRKKERKPDELWDTLVELFGGSATGVERGRWNKALAGLREAGATPEQLRAAALAYRRVFPDAAMTAMALAANWTTLTGKVRTPQELAVDSLRERIRRHEEGA